MKIVLINIGLKIYKKLEKNDILNNFHKLAKMIQEIIKEEVREMVEDK